MKTSVKVAQNIDPEMLNVLHQKLNQCHGAITEVSKEANVSYRTVL